MLDETLVELLSIVLDILDVVEVSVSVIELAVVVVIVLLGGVLVVVELVVVVIVVDVDKLVEVLVFVGPNIGPVVVTTVANLVVLMTSETVEGLVVDPIVE